MKISRIVVFVLLALAMSITPALAAKHTVGLGAGFAPEYEGSDDYEGVPMLMLTGRYDSGRSFSLMGTRLQVDLIGGEEFFFGPVLNYRMGRDDVDNSYVDGMRDIDDAFEVGAYGGFDINNFIVALSVLTDVSDTHEGTLANLAVDYRLKLSDELTVTPGLFATYADDDYMDTYFGVNAGNVGSSSLPGYKAESGVKDTGANIIVRYSLRNNWGIMGIASYKTLLGDAEDSPIVEVGDDGQAFFGLMGTYSWGSK